MRQRMPAIFHLFSLACSGTRLPPSAADDIQPLTVVWTALAIAFNNCRPGVLEQEMRCAYSSLLITAARRSPTHAALPCCCRQLSPLPLPPTTNKVFHTHICNRRFKCKLNNLKLVCVGDVKPSRMDRQSYGLCIQTSS